MHQTVAPKIHMYTVVKVTLARVLLTGVASKYMPVWDVEAVVIHQTSWHLGSTGEHHI